MAGIIGMNWGVRKKDLKLDEVAMSLDDLTEQILLANKLTAAAILHQQGALETEKYHEFLTDIYKW